MTLRAALGFFTRLPVGSAPLPPTFRGVMVWLPVVGLIVGTLVALAVWLAARWLPAPLCGVVGCLAWVGLTGGLHLDGVADCGDALFVEAEPARRLEIMKDSRLGTYSGIALFFVLTFKAAALYALAEPPGTGQGGFLALAGACCLAGTLARCLVFAAMRVPSARPGGLGEALHEGVTGRHELLAAGIGLVICVLNGPRGFGALVAAVLAAWLLLSTAKKRLGGVTGDVFGCLIEFVECVVLVVCCFR